MQLLSVLLPLAVVNGAYSHALAPRACNADNCARAVTGSAAQPALSVRSSDCASFLAVTVTPPAVTVTSAAAAAVVTPADATSSAVPTYASACSGAVRYSSACSCLGVTGTTTTVAAPTVTVAPTCLTDDQAQTFIADFVNFLTNTKANFNFALANATLANDFVDYSDSINYLTGAPLGGPTFPSKAAFIGGQSNLNAFPPIITLNYWITCNTITWRWKALFPKPVQGINVFVITKDLTQIETNYAEFDNAAFITDVGGSCPPPQQAPAASPSPTPTPSAT